MHAIPIGNQPPSIIFSVLDKNKFRSKIMKAAVMSAMTHLGHFHRSFITVAKRKVVMSIVIDTAMP